jgi:SMODS and SLOG-associating 2TM effector domain 1
VRTSLASGTQAAAPAGIEAAQIRRLDEARDRYDQTAVRLQRRWLLFGRVAALLGPTAVLVLALQVLLVPEGGGAALALIGLELLILAVALAVGFMRLGEAHMKWVDDRVRAEVLRRERFLLQARVGPYLSVPDASLEDRVAQRLAVLGSDLEEVLPLTRLQDRTGETWRDALEDAGRAASPAALPALASRMTHYLEQRVADQRQWFHGKAHLHERRDERLENLAKGVLILALVFAAIHLGMLLTHAHGEHDWKGTVVTLMAFVLPPAGAACVGFRALLESRRLNRSYAHHARDLAEAEHELRALMERPDAGEASFAFRRLVLRTEDVLSNELRQWWFVMRPSVPTAEA